MAVTVRTKDEAEAAGLKVPEWAKAHPIHLGHHDDDGTLACWGLDRDEVDRIAAVFD